MNMQSNITEYKFIDEDSIFEFARFDLCNAVCELRKCLISEDVSLTSDDIIRLIDVFLRLTGIGKGYTDDNKSKAIDSICGFLEYVTLDINEDLLCTILDRCNEAMEEEGRKFDDIESIKANTKVIFKEISIFVTDLFTHMQKFVLETSAIRAEYYVQGYSGSIRFDIELLGGDDIVIPKVYISSDVLFDKSPDKIYIIGQSYEKEALDFLVNKFYPYQFSRGTMCIYEPKKKEESKDESNNDGSDVVPEGQGN